MKQYLRRIRENMTGMSYGQKFEYIMMYYRYHILGILGVSALAVFLVVRIAVGAKEPCFTMVLINQPIDYERDGAIEQAFVSYLGAEGEKNVDINSDYNFSYDGIKLEGVNESSYEKFFFRLGGGELDGVIMPESFYRHCLEMDVEFVDLSSMDTGKLEIFFDDGKQAAIRVEETGFSKWLDNRTGEELLLAFPALGGHREACQEFLDFLGSQAV